MKTITTLIFTLSLFFTTQGQTWSCEFDSAGGITITDTGTPHPHIFNEYWEYIFHGECYQFSTGQMAPGDTYEIELTPAEFELLKDGALMRKVFWYKPTATLNWQSQTSTCFARLLPDQYGAVDTVYADPVSITINAILGAPNWYTLDGNPPELTTTPAAPDGVKIEMFLLTNQAGQMVSGYLSPGLYFYSLLIEWQEMPFLQEGSFLIN